MKCYICSVMKNMLLQFFRIINSVGSECHVDNVEVTGSNPVWSTDYKKPISSLMGFFVFECYIVRNEAILTLCAIIRLRRDSQ